MMLDRERNKGENHISYYIKQWNIKGSFDILNDISEHVSLVKLMNRIGNVNHAVIIVVKLIFDSNY